MAAKAGLILLARLSSSEMKRCFSIDALPTETGYQFRARLVGVQDAKGSRVRVYFEGLQRFCDIKSDVVLDVGAWRTLDFTQAYPSLLDFIRTPPKKELGKFMIMQMIFLGQSKDARGKCPG